VIMFLFSVEFLFLLWGIRLCIMVRKAPSEFNESRFISMAIYNEFLLSIFLNVSMWVKLDSYVKWILFLSNGRFKNQLMMYSIFWKTVKY